MVRLASSSPPTRSRALIIMRAIYMTALKRGRDDSKSSTYNLGSHPGRVVWSKMPMLTTLGGHRARHKRTCRYLLSQPAGSAQLAPQRSTAN